MTPATDWAQAFRIVGGGLLAVFVIMSLLAAVTYFMGRIFHGMAQRKKENEKQAAAAGAKP